MNLGLAISHDPATGLTCGLLSGCSPKQQKFVIQELRTNFCALACHPLLLPILITEFHRSLIARLGAQLWVRLLSVEISSGQTEIYTTGLHLFLSEDRDYDMLIKEVLEVIQDSIDAETHTQNLLLSAEAIQEGINHLNTLSHHHDMQCITGAAAVLTERLALISHQAKVMLSESQLIYKRGQAQMTAVRSSAQERGSLLIPGHN